MLLWLDQNQWKIVDSKGIFIPLHECPLMDVRTAGWEEELWDLRKALESTNELKLENGQNRRLEPEDSWMDLDRQEG